MKDDAQNGRESDDIARVRLREAALGGVRWVTMSRVVAEVSLLAALVVLARLISPAQFGHAAIALIVQPLVVALTCAGFGTPLVQRKTLRTEHIAAAQAVVLALGVVLTVVTAVLAPFVVEPTLGTETSQLVQLASLLFLIGSVGVVPQALLQRKLEFRRLSMAETASSVAGALASIVLAIKGLNADAVVLGVIVAHIALCGTLFAFAPPPLPRWHWLEVREILDFGGPTSLGSLLRSGFRNVDYAILGVVAGPAAVGYYWRAFQLGVEYQRKISGIMLRIALPLYSRAASLSDMRAVRDRIARANATIIFPLLAILIATAPEAIPWIFGPGWEQAIVPTQILAVAGMCASVLSGFDSLVLAVGKPKALLAWDAGSLVLYAGVVYTTAGFGVTTLCIAVAAVFLAQLLAAHVFLLRPLVSIPVRQALYDVLPALIGSTVLIVAATPLFETLRSADVPPLLTIGVSAAVGICAYMLTLRLLFQQAWFDFQLLFRHLVAIDKVQVLFGRLLSRGKVTSATSSSSV